MIMKGIIFTEEAIQEIFGHEAAEDENPERLRKYYFKNDTYDRIIADLPLRILVGHKGIGKSALFKVAMYEDESLGYLPILIKPDDIIGIGSGVTDFLKVIREWKTGLIQIICRKVLESVGVYDDEKFAKLKNFGGKILSFIEETFNANSFNLEPAKQKVITNFLKSHKIKVYIDDLDRGWVSSKEDISRISALLNAVRDLLNDNSGLQFKISLRSDVYFLVRTSDESTDKIEGSVVWYSWTNHEILIMLAKRVITYQQRNIDDEALKRLEQYEVAKYLSPVLEEKFSGKGKWENAPSYRILMSLIRKRPRDLVKLCTLAAREASSKKKNIIDTASLECIFEEYSQGRIQDTINEYRTELPDIEKLILGMKPTKKVLHAHDGYVYTTPDLKAKINTILSRYSLFYTGGKKATADDLASFLYKINFITARKEVESGVVDRKYFEENRYLSNKFADFGYDWEVHPAYRWALQPDSIDDIFNKLKLSKD